jgi:hypothetical protein
MRSYHSLSTPQIIAMLTIIAIGVLVVALVSPPTHCAYEIRS